ncbi:MAG TPA: cation:proton antiporter [Elusimicrobiota bacterium]|nr:cation:proton antiporter [Elusimicrobiota bacterium]
MTPAHIFSEIIIIFSAAVLISYLFQKLRQPSIVGFLITGVLLGPSCLSLIANQQLIEILAEVGIILLLFTIGLEFSLSHFGRWKKQILLGGTLQILVTVAAAMALIGPIGLSPAQGLILGFLLALSSTAIGMKLLFDNRELDSPHGRITAGILLFQDICVIPILLIIQIIGNNPTQFSVFQILWVFFKGLGVSLLLFFALRLSINPLLNRLARLKNKETFILSIALIALGTAGAADRLGLSPALGAFLAGLVLAESRYAHQVAADILPLRYLLGSLFFISIGMLLDLRYLAGHFLSVGLLTALTISVKAGITSIVLYLLTRSLRMSVLIGLMLAQIGEFSFVLAQISKDTYFLPETGFQMFLAVSVLTMIATPFIMQAAPKISFWITRWGSAGPLVETENQITKKMKNHVIIIGFGLNGQNMARVLNEIGISFVVVDLNPKLIQLALERKYVTLFGDASHGNILNEAGLMNARILVVAISDPVSTRRTVARARQLNPDIHLLVRTHYADEIAELYRLGATQVIPEDFETSVEIFSRVLQELHIPRNLIQAQTDIIRKDGYAMFRGLSLSSEAVADFSELLKKTTVETMILPEKSLAVGKTLGELDLSRQGAASVMVIIQDGRPRTNPDADTRLKAGDMLILYGNHAAIDRAQLILTKSEPTA